MSIPTPFNPLGTLGTTYYNWEPACFIDYSNTVYSETYLVTDFIPVSARYTVQGSPSQNITLIVAFYDAEKKYLSYWSTSYSSVVVPGVYRRTVGLYSRQAYVRVQILRDLYLQLIHHFHIGSHMPFYFV